MASNELLQGLIEATLAGSAAILLVLALRRPLRRAFGARAAYALWLLAPLAVQATLLPAATVDAGHLPLAQALVLPATFTAPAASAPEVIDWNALLSGLWLAGVAASAAWLWRMQVAFRRSLGHLLPQGDALRAQAAIAGLPATLGLWHPQVVLPADFESRFDAAQQALVLAHERRHIARRDAWANAAAALLRCLFWFDPLFHLAAARMRHDQELACDADVLAAHPRQRRRYGDALLNAQLALQTAPLGCHFGFGHPLKERIAMLGTSACSPMRRFSGTALVAVLGCGVAFAAWAVQPQTASSGPVPQQVAPVESAAPRNDPLQPGHVLGESRALHPPRYPADALKEGKTGVTVLVVEIDAQGGVTGVKIDRSSGDARLDAAAQEAAARWRFMPAMKQGKPVASKVRVPVEFAMDEPGDAAAAGERPARVAAAMPPAYPAAAKQQGIAGSVVLLVDVDAQGKPTRVAVEQSSPAGVFDAAALDAVRQWRFEPALSQGKPVAGRVRVPLGFGPQGGKGNGPDVSSSPDAARPAADARGS